jgi:hypothetical protein
MDACFVGRPPCVFAQGILQGYAGPDGKLDSPVRRSVHEYHSVKESEFFQCFLDAIYEARLVPAPPTGRNRGDGAARHRC